VFASCSAAAQTDSLAQKVRYYNSFMSGALIGCGPCINGKDFAFSFTTFHGLAWKSGIKLGAGAGLDMYADWRMVPVMVGFTFDEGRRKNAVYLQINTGYSFGKFLPVEEGSAPLLNDKGGFTVNPMVGFRMGNDVLRVYIQAGYKYQHALVNADYQQWWGWLYSYSREYDFNRFVVQLGFGLN
jgi:hypothetical protein